jgi:hypothetical protein
MTGEMLAMTGEMFCRSAGLWTTPNQILVAAVIGKNEEVDDETG